MGRGQTVDASFHMHSSNDDLQQFDGLENLLCVKALSLSSQECISQQNHHEDRQCLEKMQKMQELHLRLFKPQLAC